MTPRGSHPAVTLIRGAGDLAAHPVDVRMADGRIAEVGAGLSAHAGEMVVDAQGGALLPGLHDHHLHLRATAAALQSVDVSPAAAPDRAAFERVLHEGLKRQRRGWLRLVGYHDSTLGPLDRSALDHYVPARPIRVQHRSGAMWILNSPACRMLGLDTVNHPGVERAPDGTPTGRLFRMDEWLHEALRNAGGHEPLSAIDFAEAAEKAASRGVTGFTDATPGTSDDDIASFAGLAESGRIPQRLHLMAEPGARPPESPLVTLGPVKVLIDDVDLPLPDELARRFAAAHAAGRAVAVHCVTRVQLVVTLEAFRQSGTLPGDRIEHASVVPGGVIADIAELGPTVVTNPGFIATRGEQYLQDVEPEDAPLLYRCASLVAAGIPVAAGTDAPFGSADPWVAIRAAVDRVTAGGRVIGAAEALPPEAATGLFLGPAGAPGARRSISAGQPADVCLLAEPLANAVRSPQPVEVAATWVAGRLVAGSRFAPK